MNLELQLETIVSQPFAENTYVANIVGRSDCVIVDPGFEPEPVIQYIQEQRLEVAAILNTHGHADHIAGNGAMKEQFPNAPLVIGAGDEPMLSDPMLNLSGSYGFDLISPPADKLLYEGEDFTIAGFTFEILETPGHSSGHIVFVWRGGEHPWVLGGDVLFREGIGRTDFPNGSFEQLETAIRTKLYVLPESTVVLPGHGPQTTIGHEKQFNPFVGDAAR